MGRHAFGGFSKTVVFVEIQFGNGIVRENWKFGVTKVTKVWSLNPSAALGTGFLVHGS